MNTSFKPREANGITSLFVVPHRDLAQQLVQWTKVLAVPSDLVQICIRDSSRPTSDQMTALGDTPPGIVFGTPQALLDIVNMEGGAERLGFGSLGTIVVDEADQMLALPGSRASPKEWKKYHRHPAPLQQLLDGVFRERWDAESGSEAVVGRKSERAGPQLVVSSATLSSGTREYFFRQRGWMLDEEKAIVIEKTSDRSGVDRLPGLVKHKAFTVERSGELVSLEADDGAESKWMRKLGKDSVFIPGEF